jgi:hypothetical protein
MSRITLLPRNYIANRGDTRYVANVVIQELKLICFTYNFFISHGKSIILVTYIIIVGYQQYQMAQRHYRGYEWYSYYSENGAR